MTPEGDLVYQTHCSNYSQNYNEHRLLVYISFVGFNGLVQGTIYRENPYDLHGKIDGFL